jgi:hypothetical protein
MCAVKAIAVQKGTDRTLGASILQTIPLHEAARMAVNFDFSDSAGVSALSLQIVHSGIEISKLSKGGGHEYAQDSSSN